nr:glycosyltransferase family 1 protein [uncultured Chryseobacterium sp.]
MKIHFFERRIIPTRISIEKVFSIIKLRLIEENITVKTFKNPYSSLFKMLNAMWYFKNNQGDINHITGDIHWVCYLLNSDKTILTIHDIVGVSNYKSKIRKNIYLLLWVYLPLIKLKYITVISQKTKDEILEFYPAAEKKIRVIHNPLTNKIFYRETIMKKPEDFKLLIVGTRENKNLERILDATKFLNCEIFIVGETNEAQRKKIAESKARITINEFVSDNILLELYKTCDILCFPSLYEGFGMPIIEAQSNGCAVITSNIEPMKSLALDSALFVNPYDVEDIRNKIVYLQKNEEKRKELTDRGYSNAENFLPEKITQQYINLYKEVLNG